jgi:hypothetical protein
MSPLKDTSSPSPPFAQGTNFVMEIAFTTICVEVSAEKLGPPPLAGPVASSWQPREDIAKAVAAMRVRYFECMVPPGTRWLEIVLRDWL